MKFLTLTVLLIASTTAFSKAPQVGEVSTTSGTSLTCCPTGTCSDKTIPVCAGVTDLRDRGDVNTQRSTPPKTGKSRASRDH
ncbi:MAG: hypothetical protein ACJ76H_16430 [Bacteriovoracaceae bacterium]